MNNSIHVALMALVLSPFLATSSPAADISPDAAPLVDRVMKASGLESRPNVTAIRFTFEVWDEGKKVRSVSHDWDLAKGLDHVVWDDKDIILDTRKKPDSTADPDVQQAYKHWINDTYWLLAPLKLKDPGVKISSSGKKMYQNSEYDTLLLSFESVGLTPQDQYVFYIIKETGLPIAWELIREGKTVLSASWEEYQKSGGLVLSTRHDMGTRQVLITNLSVVSAP